MFNPLHGSMNQELFEKHLYSQSSHYENYKSCTPQLMVPLLSEKWSIHYASSSARFGLLCTAVWIKNFLKSSSVIKVATMKNTDNYGLHYANACYYQIDTFHYEYNTK